MLGTWSSQSISVPKSCPLSWCQKVSRSTRASLKQARDYPKSTLRWVKGRASLLCVREDGISVLGGVYERNLGGCLPDLPPQRSLAPFWTGSLPASALAPSEWWTAPAESIWGLEPPGLPLGQYGGRRVRTQNPGHLADPTILAAHIDTGDGFLHPRAPGWEIYGLWAAPPELIPLSPCPTM